jgi:hypothetical protein
MPMTNKIRRVNYGYSALQKARSVIPRRYSRLYGKSEQEMNTVHTLTMHAPLSEDGAKQIGSKLEELRKQLKINI